ncbi:MAG: hypothetical protein ACYCVH_11055 [Ignavibacteriaceae bacterium]
MRKKLTQEEKDRRLENGFKWASIFASVWLLIQLVGVWYAAQSYTEAEKFNNVQIINAKKFEKRKNAIDLLNKVYNSEFLNSFSILKRDINATHLSREDVNAWNLVFSTYYLIAVAYNSKIADSLIIEKSVKQGIKDFVNLEIYRNDTTIVSAKNEIDSMLTSMNSNRGVKK